MKLLSEYVVLYEHLYSLVFGHAELVVEAGRSLCTVFGALPELAFVVAGEGNDVFLREVAIDGVTFSDNFIGAEGHCHVYHVELPLLPCAAVEPQTAIFQILGLYRPLNF